jgi:MFS family permease
LGATKAATRLIADLVPAESSGRRWVYVNIVNATGDGLFLSGNAVFATKVIGLTGEQVGVALSLAGIAGIAGAGMLGPLVDRFGARRLLLIMLLSQVALYLSYGAITAFIPFVLVMCLISMCKNGATSASAVLVSQIASASGRVSLRAQARTGYNVGFSLGAVFAAAALAIGTKSAYYALPFGNAVSFLAACAVVMRLPGGKSGVGAKRLSLGALRDFPFLITTGLTCVLSIHASLLTLVVPLWIVERTKVPTPFIGVYLVMNTIFVILFQVAASKGTESVEGSTRKARLAGVTMLLGCVALAPSGAVPTAVAVLLVAAAVLLLSACEILQSASAWAMSYALAPAGAQAEYLGAFAMSSAGQSVLASAIGTALVLRYGATGWLAIGVCVMSAAVLLGPAARWAHASITRHHAVSPADRIPET